MRAAPRSKSIREAQKVLFIDGVQHFDGGPLDDLVFQRGNSERAKLARFTHLRDVHSAHRACPVRSSLKPMGEIVEIFLQSPSVVLPRLAVYARCRAPLDFQVRRSQSLHVANVLQERGEPLFLILLCCLTYPLQRAWRTIPALRPECVTLGRVPLGQSPSLHRLRSRFLDFVRRLRRYFGTVRLPASVHHRRTSFDFPMRPAVLSSAGGRGISRFPHKVFPHMHGVCDRAGL